MKKQKKMINIINFIKKEIQQLTRILTDKEKFKNPFVAFKYLLYIPLSILIATLIIVILLLCGFTKGVWNYER